ncbi:Na+/H+ antiporter subunit E [Jeotgalibacillus proteolyticus]|uniref:Na+/H+ antiporter subunit E n=1 Tax=Jeotgalibacillus proteolyticus TaxID=2082395 RepID=A0A2S5GAR3_9BACL|nr:Na+/H+ antiporter subunit E [Jeotgalibacillus proteolyticus]PPA70004.1 Na+/H+ antiporter subunit E [Jeotgalibacillus proteolyticus]
MAFQLLLNFFLAFLWMFMAGTFNLANFIIGYFLGMLVIFGMRRFLSGRFYMGKIVAIIKLTLMFVWELIKANFEVLLIVLKPKMDMKPGIFKYDTELKKDWEITLLSLLITLTPGTLVMDVSDDNETLYIHALNIPDVNQAVSSIKDGFEKAIMEVSR